jgi:hypothetical protein
MLLRVIISNRVIHTQVDGDMLDRINAELHYRLEVSSDATKTHVEELMRAG